MMRRHELKRGVQPKHTTQNVKGEWCWQGTDKVERHRERERESEKTRKKKKNRKCHLLTSVSPIRTNDNMQEMREKKDFHE
jgi:hypothetical protein